MIDFIVTDGREILFRTDDRDAAMLTAHETGASVGLIAPAAAIATMVRFIEAHQEAWEAGLRRATWKNAEWLRSPRCAYCRRRMARESATVDHVIPLCQGGPDEPENWRLCCQPCNEMKGGRTPRELLAWLAGNCGCQLEVRPLEAAAA